MKPKTLVFIALISPFLAIALKLTFTGVLLPARSITVRPPEPSASTTLAGKGWAYTVPFAIRNEADIEKLIQCESQGVNVARPDSNGLISWGILQFNGTSTWQEMEKRFRYYGSPMIPDEAIHMADMMINDGFLKRWTCARILRI